MLGVTFYVCVKCKRDHDKTIRFTLPLSGCRVHVSAVYFFNIGLKLDLPRTTKSGVGIRTMVVSSSLSEYSGKY